VSKKKKKIQCIYNVEFQNYYIINQSMIDGALSTQPGRNLEDAQACNSIVLIKYVQQTTNMDRRRLKLSCPNVDPAAQLRVPVTSVFSGQR
jgi:hypothetical protein